MFGYEFKNNLWNFVIWLSILALIFLIVYLIYPYIITDETMNNMDELMKVFPPEVLKAFNMDVSSISTAYGWFKSEGYMFVLLIIGIYSSMLGGNILLKEENNKTIEYLYSLPIKRNSIIFNKLLVGFIYVFLLILLFALFNFIALLISCDFDKIEFLLLSIAPIFAAIPLFCINLFISTFFHKKSKTIGISLGIVFLSYILNMMGEISSNVDFLKYFSIYTLVDVRNIIENNQINLIMIIISFIITTIAIIGTYINYNKKELL